MLNKNSIAIVGARKCSKYGAKYSAKFAKELARADICIISGLANGIDAIAHTYSKSERGKTIAVIGSGFNNIYPKENILLLPLSVIAGRQGKGMVTVIKDGEQIQTEVTLGATDGAYIEILSGVEEGDVVSSVPPNLDPRSNS